MRRSRGAALAAGAVEAVADDPGRVAGELGVVGVAADRGDSDAVLHTVAALYVDPRGVYADAPGVDVWDEARDARLYEGPWPVVAHPPCARWCQLASVNEARWGTPIGDDGGSFAAALAAVRRFGGVLEHPAYSLAWDAFDLPKPTRGMWVRSLFDPGWVTELSQSAYGHPARKRTWLYLVGEPLTLEWSEPATDGAVSAGVHSGESSGKRRVQRAEANATPLAFRDALLSLVLPSASA
jgi:hypothetical protein